MRGRVNASASLGVLAASLAVAFAAALAIGGGATSAAGDAAPVVRLALPPGELALGHATAPLTMIEFTDYQCPYCRRFQSEVWPKLKREYIDTGKLRYIARDLPLSIHAAAVPAAEAAHCAGDQGKFWEMHAALLGGAADLSDGGIARRAHAIGLEAGGFDECLARNKYRGLIAAHAQEADAAGINGTPGFVVGRAAHGELTGVRIEGALPYEEFDSLLQELLAAR